jgi:hypothetical protein
MVLGDIDFSRDSWILRATAYQIIWAPTKQLFKLIALWSWITMDQLVEFLTHKDEEK